VAATMAVNIDLDADEQITLTSDNAALPLPLKKDAKYFIHCRNIRLEHEKEIKSADQWLDILDQINGMSPNPAMFREMTMSGMNKMPASTMKSADGISDFQFYYHAIKNLTVLDHYDFEPVSFKEKDHGAAPLICYSTGGSQTGT
jgi:hypothetical protein